jgi:hypothetical protein
VTARGWLGFVLLILVLGLGGLAWVRAEGSAPAIPGLAGGGRPGAGRPARADGRGRGAARDPRHPAARRRRERPRHRAAPRQPRLRRGPRGCCPAGRVPDRPRGAGALRRRRLPAGDGDRLVVARRVRRKRQRRRYPRDHRPQEAEGPDRHGSHLHPPGRVRGGVLFGVRAHRARRSRSRRRLLPRLPGSGLRDPPGRSLRGPRGLAPQARRPGRRRGRGGQCRDRTLARGRAGASSPRRQRHPSPELPRPDRPRPRRRQ